MADRRAQGLAFINAQLSGGDIATLRVEGPRIAGIAEHPRAGDRVIDLEGDRLLPGLINAHDHLQLNSLPQRESQRLYRSAGDWISEVAARRLADPEFAAAVAVGRQARLLMGGLKNLLSGVTTVAHHDPLYPYLCSSEFPIRVVRSFGWSHSLSVDGEERVRDSYRRTPADWPWIIHAAEGLDDEAAGEFDRLETLGCLGPKTLLVHGLALNHARRSRLRHADAGLIWCPSSNLRLFGTTTEVADLVRHGRAALGSDSRLSGARDLLEELRIAAGTGGLDDPALERLVTSDSARLLRLPDRGSLQPGMRADLLVLPARSRLADSSRVDVRLVVIGGRVRYGDLSRANRVEPAAEWARIRVDGHPKVLAKRIGTWLKNSAAQEPGIDLNWAWRAA